MKLNIRKVLIPLLCCICFINLFQTSVFADEIESINTDSSISISSRYAIVVDMDTGEVIYSLNADKQTQMASTTKLMTAILLSENKKKDDLLSMSSVAKALPSSSIVRDRLPAIEIGEKITADNVMKGLLLSSGNDMAEIIAESVSGSSKNFSILMNNRAKELGLSNTNFYTPNGLDADNYLDGNEHYSTAYDMSLVGIEALKHDWIKNTMGMEKANFTTVSGHSCELLNTNKNLNKKGCIGGKTGYTDKAGRCLVAYYKVNNKNLVGVTLGGEANIFFDDMNKIIEYSSKKTKDKIISKGETLKETSVEFKPSKYTDKIVNYDIPLFTNQDVMQYKNDYNSENTKFSYEINDNIDTQALDSNTIIGTLTITTNTGESSYDLYTSSSTSDFLEDNKDYINKINRNVKIIAITILAFISLVIAAILRIRYVKKRRERRLRRKSLRNLNIKR